MKKCEKCGREVTHLRRGFCLACYRAYTGFSGGKDEISQIQFELKKVTSRLLMIEERLELLKEHRKRYKRLKE